MSDQKMRPAWAEELNQSDYELAIDRGLFTVRAAAGYAGTGPGWIYDRIGDGTLSKQKVGRRFLIRKCDLDKLIGYTES